MSTLVAIGQARLDLRPFAVTRGDERTKNPEELVLSRARLKTTILLQSAQSEASTRSKSSMPI